MKRYLLLTAVLIGLSAVYCWGSGTSEDADSAPATVVRQSSSAVFDEPVEISMLIPSGTSWPFQEDWYVLEKIKQETNVTFDMTVASSNFDDKLSITIASGNIPDIIAGVSTAHANRYGDQGAFINAFEYEEDMPAFLKWKNENKASISGLMSADGKLYLFPSNEIGETNRQGWLYRQDVFEKNNMSAPTNDEELYNVSKKLKELYPDSYPVTFRSPYQRIAMIATSWGAGDNGVEYPPYFYDAKSNSWKYAPVEDGYKNLLMFLRKLYSEEIIPPDAFSLDTKAWQDRISADMAFITFDYLVRIDFFNTPLRKDNPEFTMAYMPPVKGGPSGSVKKCYTATYPAGLAVYSKSKMLDKVLRYVDWMFTDEAKEMLSWGEEGETYQIVGGKREYIDALDVTDLRKKTGLSTIGMYTRFDFDAHIAAFSPELAYAVTEDKKYDMEPPVPGIFTSQEQETVALIGQAINNHTEEMIAKFIIGVRSLDEWNEYVQEIENLGLDKMLAIYEASHARIKKALE